MLIFRDDEPIAIALHGTLPPFDELNRESIVYVRRDNVNDVILQLTQMTSTFIAVTFRSTIGFEPRPRLVCFVARDFTIVVDLLQLQAKTEGFQAMLQEIIRNKAILCCKFVTFVRYRFRFS